MFGFKLGAVRHALTFELTFQIGAVQVSADRHMQGVEVWHVSIWSM